MTEVAQAACSYGNRGGVYSFIILDDVALGYLKIDIVTSILLILFQIDSIPYLLRIISKEWSNVFVPYSLFYKTDVTLEGHLRRLHVSTGTAAVFTRITNCSPF